MSIGNNIRNLRKKHGLTQKEFGQIAGVIGNTVTSWEKGRMKPNERSLNAIANYFNISKDELVESTEQSHKKPGMIPGEIVEVDFNKLNYILGKKDMTMVKLSASIGRHNGFISECKTIRGGIPKVCFPLVCERLGCKPEDLMPDPPKSEPETSKNINSPQIRAVLLEIKSLKDKMGQDFSRIHEISGKIAEIEEKINGIEDLLLEIAELGKMIHEKVDPKLMSDEAKAYYLMKQLKGEGKTIYLKDYNEACDRLNIPKESRAYAYERADAYTSQIGHGSAAKSVINFRKNI